MVNIADHLAFAAQVLIQAEIHEGDKMPMPHAITVLEAELIQFQFLNFDAVKKWAEYGSADYNEWEAETPDGMWEFANTSLHTKHFVGSNELAYTVYVYANHRKGR